MKWIAGLGNPGMSYQGTRHNVGFLVVDELAKRFDIKVNQSKCKALMGEGNVNGTKVVLIKPMTYMNLSGESLRAFMDYYKADLSDGIVVYDDLDTELGRIRLRYQAVPAGITASSPLSRIQGLRPSIVSVWGFHGRSLVKLYPTMCSPTSLSVIRCR